MKKDYKTLVLPEKYIPKKSEKYMSVEQKAYFYKILMSEKAELETDLSTRIDRSHLAQKLDSIGAMDEGDAATLAVETDFAIKLQERDRAQLGNINTALQRLEDGTYGYSIVSGKEIGLKRLMVRPVAVMTIEEREATGE
ncbi:MAG: hypothetical protein LBD94_02920 [Rickettsiales bacterium]|jgi:DnaK suppressor protein|nr:hypothetical protein [Rickettsiales bacterium]